MIADLPAEVTFQKDVINHRHFEKVRPLSPLPFEDDRANLGVAGRTVLVIEDDVKFAKIIFNLAHELKYKCIIAQGADEGLSLIHIFTNSGSRAEILC